MIREEQEQWEKEYLSPYAMLSCNTKGRKVEEAKCDVRTDFARDRDRILHCKAFRRLKHKTQVFLAPEGDHYRTRLTHTLEVAQIARTIARALRLNEDLVEAMALGHDLGHTPFGHAGEAALNSVSPFGYEHNMQSIRIVELLEKKGQGLNLTYEVKDGIMNHQTSRMPSTLEGKVVRLSDKIAYINHDIDDAIRGGILTEEDLPKEYTDILGNTVRIRLNTMIHDMIKNSLNQNDIRMSKEIEAAMVGLRKFMFDHVYTSPIAKAEETKAKKLLVALYEYYNDNISLLPEEYLKLIENGEKKEQVVCDYIAGMTDPYAISTYRNIFEPKAWKIR